MKKMNNKELGKAVIIFLVGALLGWMFTARMYGAGPLASLDGTHSDASTIGKQSTQIPPWVPKGTNTSTSTDLLGSTFWIASPDTCQRHNATPTGRVKDNIDTGERLIECRANKGVSTGE